MRYNKSNKEEGKMETKTRWFKLWESGEVGKGGCETLYQNDNSNVIFLGYRRLDFPTLGETWRNIEVNETLKTISGSIWHRIA